MLHRIFVAFNLPESVKTDLLAYQEKWRELPCRWATRENLHITLVFLGNTSDGELQEVSRILKETGKAHAPFSVELSRIAFGPSFKEPRMLWGEGKASKELLALQKDIEKRLGESKVLRFVPEKRPWALHLTLGRLNEFAFRRIEPEERPEINKEISLSFHVNSVEIMESKLKRGGTAYSVVESVGLTKGKG